MSANFLVKEALSWGTQELQKNHLPNPRRESTLLLQAALKQKNNPILLSPETKLTKDQEKTYRSHINRRSRHEPFAYITGQVIFHGLSLKVNQDVLIPRPETEQLVELIIEYLKSLPSTHNLHPPMRRAHPSILEVGTGSGAIAIALANSLPASKIIATDISPTALKVALSNIKKHNFENQIKLQQGNLLQSFPSQSIDVLIANLPYIPSHWLQRLDLDIIEYEPNLALDGGQDGLGLIETLIQQAKNKIRPGSAIFLEIWHEHAKSLEKIIKANFPHVSFTIIKDLANLDRFAVIKIL